MQLLHTSKCCFCADLRTGALILSYLGLIGGVLSLFLLFQVVPFFIGALIMACASAACLYGIYTKKADFVVPSIVMYIVWMGILILWIIAVVIMAMASKEFLIEFLVKFTSVREDKLREAYGATVFTNILTCIINIAFSWHWTSVLYSLWKSMKEGARPNAMYGA